MSSQTYFQKQSVSFIDVDAGAEIDTVKFLNASESVISLFALLNSTAFSLVISDMQGNVVKIRNKYLENPAVFFSLQRIVDGEKGQKKKTATEGLLWLRRALEFTSAALRRNVDDLAEELNVSFNKAYQVTLAKHHSFLVKPVFALAMQACPYRKDFYLKLGDDSVLVMQEMQQWLCALEKVLAALLKFYVDGGHTN